MNELFGSLINTSSLARSTSAEGLVELSKQSIEVLPALVQWIEQQPDDVPIGDAIDALRSILE